MARKTKADAQITRDQLLDAAERLFERRGVSRTSLQQIAEHAGLTRGAIYWHFKDKGELFIAMMDRVHLPFEAIIERLQQDDSHSPLTRLRQILLECLGHIQADERTRRVFTIASQKVEMIDETHVVIERRRDCKLEFLVIIEQALREAADADLIRTELDPRLTAMALHDMVDGLIYNWLLDPSSHDLVSLGLHAYDIFIAGLRSNLELPAHASSRRQQTAG